jgi:hypothetical protein
VDALLIIAKEVDIKQKLFIAYIALICLVSVFLSCVSYQLEKVTLEEIKSIPAKILANYDFNPDSAITDRISCIPDFLLTRLKEIDKKDSYSSYIPSREENEMINQYISLLPPMHKHVLKERLIGIYFVKNFLGSGFADYVFGENDKLYTIMVFNPETLKKTISDWVTYKEQTCFDFKGDDSTRIVVNCGDVFTGFMYVLLHESTHIVDYLQLFTPYVDWSINDIGFGSEQKETDFTADIWENYYTPLPHYDFSARKDLTFYGWWGGPKISAKRALSVYDDLSYTPFVSLYASTSWAEDFAEFITWYHFTYKLKQPYEILIYRDAVVAQSYQPMDFPNVQKRTTYIMSIYY